MGRLPEIRPGQWVEQPAAEVQRDRFRPGELDRHMGSPFGQFPVLAAMLAGPLLQRELGRTQGFQVAMNRPDVDADFAG